MPAGHIYLDENSVKQSQGFLQVRCLCMLHLTRGDVCPSARPSSHLPCAVQVRLRDRFTSRELLIATTHLKSKEGALEERVRAAAASLNTQHALAIGL